MSRDSLPGALPSTRKIRFGGNAVIGLLVLVTIWWHRYPAGVDLPHHANLIANLGRLLVGSASIELESIYSVEWFTPYAVCYAIGAVLSIVFAPLVTMKLLLTAFAFGMWGGLARWLRTVGGDPFWALVGFPVFFGYGYLWGFLSNLFALSVLFFYLADLERALSRPWSTSGLTMLVWGIFLFFSHGITFGLAMLITVARLLMRRDVAVWIRVGWHLVPLALLTLLWTRSQVATGGAPSVWFSRERVELLFSAPFETFASRRWAELGFLLVVGSLVALRPRLNPHGGAWAAFGIGLAAFVVLPEWLASTWLVGPRMVVFVQAFFPALFLPRPRSRNWLIVSHVWVWGLTLGLLVLLNVRLAAFNREVEGMDVLSKRLDIRADLFQLPRQSNANSAVFGRMSLTHMPAWLTAASGAIENEDTSFYYNMPLRRRSDAFPQWFEYGLAHGTLAQSQVAARAEMGSTTEFVASAGEWHLFRRPPREARGVILIRAMQDWGKLAIDSSVSGRPLRVAGRSYQAGLGTHANSLIRIRAAVTGVLKGSCGVDGNGLPAAKVRCRILTPEREVRFDSGGVDAASPPASFELPVASEEELVLEAVSLAPSITGGHVDWLDLRVD